MNTAMLGPTRAALILAPTLPRRRPTGLVFAKPRRRRIREPQPHEYEDEEDEAEDIGAVGLAALAALRSDPSPNPIDSPPERASDSNLSPGGSSDPGAERRRGPLRGSDVLQALQRAATAKKGKKRRPARRGEGGEQQQLAGDYENVRPIEIKSDWAHRMEKLERRVQLLLEQQHL